MKAAFIACEYNPFHNGHKHHIDESRKNGADYIVCIMSGNFVQRGDIAVAEKHIRAKTALLSGADLVLELPLKFAVSTASLFAEGFVKTAKACGIEGFFSFGAKDDIGALKAVSQIIFSDDAENFANDCITSGMNYPSAKALYLNGYKNGKYSSTLEDANNILALEYLNAIDKFYPNAEAFAVYRKGAMHDSDEITEGFTSAGNIRRMLYREISDGDFINNVYSIRELIPDATFETLLDSFSKGAFPADKNKFNTTALSRLYNLEPQFISQINNVNGGLENRITDAINRSADLDDLYELVKTKAFTHSRIRQIILNAVLGITREDITSDVSYIRVLGFNDKGRALLNTMRKTASLPVISNLSQADLNNPKIFRDVRLDSLAGKLFNLCVPCPLSGNPEYDIPPVYIKD